MKMPFQLEESTIAQLHDAIRNGETTCVKVVEHYLARVRSFNGVASQLVTRDGADVPPAEGAVRAGAALKFPTGALPASHFFPDYEKYNGQPREFGRKEATA